MPFTIRRMADPAMGGSVLDVIEFILGGDVGGRGTERLAEMCVAIPWAQVGEVVLVDGGHDVANNAFDVDDIGPVF